MKITIEAHGKTIIVDTNDEHDDIQTVVETLKGMLVTVGFHPVTVDNMFDGEMYDTPWELETDSTCRDKLYK